MTVLELYKWAIENNAENYDIMIKDNLGYNCILEEWNIGIFCNRAHIELMPCHDLFNDDEQN